MRRPSLVVFSFSDIIENNKGAGKMSNSNELNNRMNARYSSMSKGQKKLANYITDNYDKAVFLTAGRNWGKT